MNSQSILLLKGTFGVFSAFVSHVYGGWVEARVVGAVQVVTEIGGRQCKSLISGPCI